MRRSYQKFVLIAIPQDQTFMDKIQKIGFVKVLKCANVLKTVY